MRVRSKFINIVLELHDLLVKVSALKTRMILWSGLLTDNKTPEI